MSKVEEYVIGSVERVWARVREVNGEDIGSGDVSMVLDGQELDCEWVGDVGPVQLLRTVDPVDFNSTAWTEGRKKRRIRVHDAGGDEVPLLPSPDILVVK